MICLFIMAPCKKHECKKCGKVVNSDSVERWASHLRGCTNVSSETKSMLRPTAKGNCSGIVIDGSQQPDPAGPSCRDYQPSCSHTNSSLCHPSGPEPKRRAGLEVAEVIGKLTA